VRCLFLALLSLAPLLLCAAAHATDEAQAAYANGVAAFQAGDYARALDDFLLARAEGYHGVQLDYSLGATYYRLGQYQPAQREFENLLRDKQLAALAHYNLGLIAAAQGKSATALNEYRLAYTETPRIEIKRLAAAEIARLTPKQPSSWIGYAKLSTGYDDNVAFAPQSGVVAPSRQGSSLISVLAGAAGQLTGSYTDGLQITGSYYSADYPRLSLYNETLLNLGSQYRYAAGEWAARMGVSGSHVTLGGADFETLGNLRFAVQRVLSGSQRLAAGYEYQRINAAAAYDYLSGWQQQFFIEDRMTAPAYQAVIGYQHEDNRRNDLTLGNEFLSASPIRNRLYTRLVWRASDRWSWNLDLAYQKSLYGKPDILDSGNGVITLTRDDALYTASIGAEYALTKSWRLNAEYRYLRNASNVGIYSYHSNRYSISIEYLFF
jgi:hypothetical protein